MDKPFLCKIGFHKHVYVPWPDELPSWYVLGAWDQARYCLRCKRLQIPEHDCAYEYLGQYHWKTISEDIGKDMRWPHY